MTLSFGNSFREARNCPSGMFLNPGVGSFSKTALSLTSSLKVSSASDCSQCTGVKRPRQTFSPTMPARFTMSFAAPYYTSALPPTPTGGA